MPSALIAAARAARPSRPVGRPTGPPDVRPSRSSRTWGAGPLGPPAARGGVATELSHDVLNPGSASRFDRRTGRTLRDLLQPQDAMSRRRGAENLAVDVDSRARLEPVVPPECLAVSVERRPARAVPPDRLGAGFRPCSRRRARSQSGLRPCTLRRPGCRPAESRTLRASVAFWEATAPVKLPTWRGPAARSGPAVRGPGRRGRYSKVRLPRGWRPGLAASRLSSTRRPGTQRQAAVKVHGVFPSLRGEPASSPAVQFRRARGRDSAQVVAPFVQVNLPDKEFRYLRTVIVTAAVYRGLASPLRVSADGSA